MVILHKIELFTPPPSIDGTDFSGNLLELVEVEDAVDTAACFVKMDKVVERVEFSSVEDKKSWISDVTKAAKVGEEGMGGRQRQLMLMKF